MIRSVSIVAGLVAIGCSGGGTAAEVVVTANGESFSLAYAPAGTFEMGYPPEHEYAYSAPQHTVTLTQGFYIGTTEVTQALYEAVMGDNPASNYGRDGDCATCPVETVSWYDAVAFCNALSELEDLENAYDISGDTVTLNEGVRGYRLPTEAEWEYAARAGESYIYSGSDDIDEVAWYELNSGGRSHGVGTLEANAWGLHDMSGNVWEWAWDYYGDYDSGYVKDPEGPPTGVYRVFRGGSFDDSADGSRAAYRNRNYPDVAYVVVRGFRVVLPE
jgi:formylglycine-generating enzyme required for sulfatase activity